MAMAAQRDGRSAVERRAPQARRKEYAFRLSLKGQRSRWLWDRSRVSRELRETLIEEDESESLDDRFFIDLDSTDGIDEPGYDSFRRQKIS